MRTQLKLKAVYAVRRETAAAAVRENRWRSRAAIMEINVCASPLSSSSSLFLSPTLRLSPLLCSARRADAAADSACATNTTVYTLTLTHTHK